MAKIRKTYICLNCQNRTSTWFGKCPNCNEWNTIVEEEISENAISDDSKEADLVSINNLPEVKGTRLKSGFTEFDRVLGGKDGGIVAGSVVVLTGEPGIGKSTLLLQIASRIEDSIYFSAEESLEQLKLRIDRLDIKKSNLMMSAERNINSILKSVSKTKAKFVIIDSIQTIYNPELGVPPGSIVQVRENSWLIQKYAKQYGTAFVVVSHITKEGVIAGPKTLEHLVDVVLYLEGEKRTGLRVLRAIKNRYGSLEEVGFWQMVEKGFVDVEDPSNIFTQISQPAPGRALSIAVDGHRPILVEIQTLVTKTPFGYPRRISHGVDLNRLNLVLAVLENRLKYSLSQSDIYLNVVGGFVVKDPGIDLAIAASVLSNLKNKILPDKAIFIGEIGLLGEVRKPAYDHLREKEADRLKYKTFLPKSLKELIDVF